jgi:hypothetical protein
MSLYRYKNSCCSLIIVRVLGGGLLVREGCGFGIVVGLCMKLCFDFVQYLNRSYNNIIAMIVECLDDV